MTLEILTKDMIAAMKEKDVIKKDVLSSLIGNIKNMAIDQKCKDNISEELVNNAILKEIKIVQEQIDTCPDSRPALLNKYKCNLTILQEYAPKQLSEEEIKNILNTKFADVITTKNKGQIMKAIMPEFKGKADGKMINEIVSEICK